MSLVVFLRGVNVGGHRTFRPSVLAGKLRHLNAVNIGAAGTFIIRRRVSRSQVRRELARRLPFDTEVILCEGREILRLVSQDPFRDQPRRPGIVCFVSVLSRRPRSEPSLPLGFPSSRRWLMRIIERRDRFVLGQYRRNMKVIGYLGMTDQLFEVPLTTRNWNTMTAIANVLRTREDADR